MTALAQWSALVGALLPLLVAIVQQPRFNRLTRTIIGIVASIIAAVLTAVIQNKLTWHTWSTALVFIGITSLTTYRNVWVPAGAAPAIELRTTPVKHRTRKGVAPHA